MHIRSPLFGRLAALAVLSASPAAAQHQHDHGPGPAAGPAAPAPLPTGRFPEIAPGFYFVPDSAGNLVVGTGAEGTLVVGVQEPSGLAKVRTLMDSLNAGPVRWVLVMSGDSAVRWADGGWSAQGATVFAHEEIRKRVRRPRGAVVVGGTPRYGFSHVIQLETNGEEIHVVHHPNGSTNADAIVHFETQKFLYLGALFTSDGYPVIDVAREGSLAGLIRSASEFLENYESDPSWIEPIIPGRGPLATFADLRTWRDMLVAVRDRVQPMVAAGRTADEVVAARPTAEFDARWGQGPVTPEAFVRSVHLSLRREAARAAREAGQAQGQGSYTAPAGQPQPQTRHQHGSP
ncbi:hypothetical protein [Longimicrobium sp.]|uniref:hypothetical protein n=1 Tax=Longimicrobium sp. TaxID=2029185 RepID=UPI003B3AC9FA